MVIRLKSSTSSNLTVSSFSDSSDFPEFFYVSLSNAEVLCCLFTFFSSSHFIFELMIFLSVDELTFLGRFVQPPRLPALDMLGVSSSKQDKVSDLMEGRVACLGR